jgi:hypothetical protein
LDRYGSTGASRRTADMAQEIKANVLGDEGDVVQEGDPIAVVE